VLGSGDPTAVVDMHIAAIVQQQQMAAAAAASPLLRSVTPLPGVSAGGMPSSAGPMSSNVLGLDPVGAWGSAGLVMMPRVQQGPPLPGASGQLVGPASVGGGGSLGAGGNVMSVSGQTSSPVGPLPGKGSDVITSHITERYTGGLSSVWLSRMLAVLLDRAGIAVPPSSRCTQDCVTTERQMKSHSPLQVLRSHQRDLAMPCNCCQQV
jgi:hypothetical protein